MIAENWVKESNRPWDVPVWDAADFVSCGAGAGSILDDCACIPIVEYAMANTTMLNRRIVADNMFSNFSTKFESGAA